MSSGDARLIEKFRFVVPLTVLHIAVNEPSHTCVYTTFRHDVDGL